MPLKRNHDSRELPWKLYHRRRQCWLLADENDQIDELDTYANEYSEYGDILEYNSWIIEFDDGFRRCYNCDKTEMN